MIAPSALALHERDVVDHRLGGHDHAGGVHAPLPLQALQAAGGVDDRLHVGVALVERAELAGLGVALVRRRRRSPASGMSLPITGGGIALVIRSPIANG